MPQDKSAVYKVKANEFEFTFTREQIEALDLFKISPKEFHLIYNHRSARGKLLNCEVQCKNQVLEVDGVSYNISIKDELEQMLDDMGYSAVSNKHIKEIKAPMPGLVLEVNVAEGQQVVQGEKVLILVAMKMENSILVHADATIKRIVVKAGQAVEKGQVLVELD